MRTTNNTTRIYIYITTTAPAIIIFTLFASFRSFSRSNKAYVAITLSRIMSAAIDIL